VAILRSCQHHTAEVWAKAAFVCLRATSGALFESRQCPKCPSTMEQSVGFVAGAQSLANRLADLATVPLSYSLAAQALATQCRLIESQQPKPEIVTVYLPMHSSDDEVVIQRGTTLEQAERLLITAALRWSGGSRTKTALLLGVTRRTIYNHLSKQDALEEDSTNVLEELRREGQPP